MQFPRQANSGERRLRCHSEGDASPHAAVSGPSKVSQISAAAGRRCCSKVSGPEITINSDKPRRGQPPDTAIESNGRLNGHSVYNPRNLDDHRCRQQENSTAFFFQLSTTAFRKPTFASHPTFRMFLLKHLKFHPNAASIPGHHVL